MRGRVSCKQHGHKETSCTFRFVSVAFLNKHSIHRNEHISCDFFFFFAVDLKLRKCEIWLAWLLGPKKRTTTKKKQRKKPFYLFPHYSNFYFYYQSVSGYLKKKKTYLNFTPARNHSQRACTHSGGKSTFNIPLCCCAAQNKRTVWAPQPLPLPSPPPPRLASPRLHTSSIPPLSKFLSLCIAPSFQFKSDRCLSGTSEPWSGSDESHKPGPTARPRLLVCQHKLPHLEAHPGTGAAF